MNDDIEAFMVKANKEGLLLNSLYQTHYTKWRASFRHYGSWSYSLGEGPTIMAALRAAYSDAKGKIMPKVPGKAKGRVRLAEGLPAKKSKRVRLGSS